MVEMIPGFLGEEILSVFKEAVMDKGKSFIKGRVDKALLQHRFEEFCGDRRWNELFESQGFRGGIDFYMLTEDLKTHIVDDAYHFYHDAVRLADQDFSRRLEETCRLIHADTEQQKHQVRNFLNASYTALGVFFKENLSEEGLFLQNDSRRYTDEQIARFIEQFQQRLPPNELKLFPSHPAFVGQSVSRENTIREIEAAFSSGVSVVALTGIGGLGKTETARQYVQRHGDEYGQVCFAYYQGSFRDTILSGLSWSSGDWDKLDVKEQLARKLGYIQAQTKRILFVFDDVDELDASILSSIAAPNRHVLLTTRKQELGGCRMLPLPQMETGELLRVFQMNSRTTSEWMERNDSSLRKLIEDILQKHTMMVALTARQYVNSDLMLDGLCDELESNRLAPDIQEKVRLYKDVGRGDSGSGEDYARIRDHVLKLYSIARVESDTEKVDVLRYMSLVPCNGGIERRLFREWTELESMDAVNELIDAGWILCENETKRIYMHSVISDAIAIQAAPNAENTEVFLENLAKKMFHDSYSIPTSIAWMIPYGESALKRVQDEVEITGRLAHNTASLLEEVAEYDRALEYYEKAVAVREKVLGTDHPSTAITLNNIAGVYQDQGDYPKALEFYEKALAIVEKVLGTDHPSTATTYNNIAGVYQDQGDYPKALEYYEKALAIVEKVLGPEHPDTATTYNNIAVVCDDQGEYPRALEFYEKALAVREKVLGPEHPDTANTYNNIAVVYKAQGEYPRALKFYEKDLKISEKVLGAEHPDTATTYNNIAGVYEAQGDYAKALEFYEKALAVRKKVLGPEHPSTAATYNNMAGVYEAQGDYIRALELYLRAFRVMLRKLGPSHPNTQIVFDNMQSAYTQSGLKEPFEDWLKRNLSDPKP